MHMLFQVGSPLGRYLKLQRLQIEEIEFVCITCILFLQTPAIMELQLSLHEQLVGTAMEPKETAVLQLQELQRCCRGKRWLVVIDGVCIFARLPN